MAFLWRRKARLLPCYPFLKKNANSRKFFSLFRACRPLATIISMNCLSKLPASRSTRCSFFAASSLLVTSLTHGSEPPYGQRAGGHRVVARCRAFISKLLVSDKILFKIVHRQSVLSKAAHSRQRLIRMRLAPNNSGASVSSVAPPVSDRPQWRSPRFRAG